MLRERMVDGTCATPAVVLEQTSAIQLATTDDAGTGSWAAFGHVACARTAPIVTAVAPSCE